MKIYMVQNNDGLVVGVFKKLNKAKGVKNVGKVRWGEKWHITEWNTGEIEKSWLSGSDKYRSERR